jgi:protoheme IX farnesyltransferase
MREAEMEVSVEEKLGVRVKIKAALDLFKLRLSFLVVVSCVLSYSMGAAEWEFDKIGWLILAGFLLAGGSNGANQILERQWDALMHRTRTRPLPTNRISPLAAWIVSLAAAGVGIFILFYYLNAASGILGFSAFLSYAFIYTPFKRISPWAVLIGAFPGAIAPLIGYVAATNDFGLEAGILFAVQFMWQFPHFWAIAWVSHEDYNRGGYKLLPFNGMPDKKTAFQIMVYSFFLIPVSLLPWTLPMDAPMVGNIAAVIVTIAGIWISVLAYNLFKEPTLLNARKVMFASFFYLPIVQIAYVIDKL